MQDIQKLIGSYSSIYPYLLLYEEYNNKSNQLTKQREKIISLPRNTAEEKKEFERRAKSMIQQIQKYNDDIEETELGLKAEHPDIWAIYNDMNPRVLLRATIQSGKKNREALLTDILLARDEELLLRFKGILEQEETPLTDQYIKDFIAKNDIYERADLLSPNVQFFYDDGIVFADLRQSPTEPNNIKSVEMVRELVRLYPNECYNIQYLYKVNDLRGVDDFLQETKCSKASIELELEKSVEYANDIKAFEHILRKGSSLGISFDPERYIYNALLNGNPEVPIYILSTNKIDSLGYDPSEFVINEMPSETVEYMLRNNIKFPYNVLLEQEQFFLSTYPSLYLVKAIQDMKLDQPVIYKIQNL